VYRSTHAFHVSTGTRRRSYLLGALVTAVDRVSKYTAQSAKAVERWMKACLDQALIKLPLQSWYAFELRLPIHTGYLSQDATDYHQCRFGCAFNAGVCILHNVPLEVCSPPSSSSSPLQQASASTPSAPTCTRVIFKQPSFQTRCTQYSRTVTFTAFTDCGGCALSTERLGLGLVSVMQDFDATVLTVRSHAEQS
jgi:hypothetical protein